MHCHMWDVVVSDHMGLHCHADAYRHIADYYRHAVVVHRREHSPADEDTAVAVAGHLMVGCTAQTVQDPGSSAVTVAVVEAGRTRSVSLAACRTVDLGEVLHTGKKSRTGRSRCCCATGLQMGAEGPTGVAACCCSRGDEEEGRGRGCCTAGSGWGLAGAMRAEARPAGR